MTRKEAITVLKAFMENPLFSEVHKAAFNIAIHDIKAYQDWNINNLILVNKDNYEPIEQESTTKNDLGVDREDAVIRLNALKQFIGYDKDSEIVKATQKSLDMAISALEHPERNDLAVDAISRADVLKLMQDNWHSHNGDWAMQESMDDIRALPSVTSQIRPKGHWIPIYQGDEIINYRCSECEFGNTFGRGTFGMDFCPRCGADMREVVEE